VLARGPQISPATSRSSTGREPKIARALRRASCTLKMPLMKRWDGALTAGRSIMLRVLGDEFVEVVAVDGF